jgi:hypothetical protein
MNRLSRKSSKLSPELRAERREEILMDRDMLRRAHLKRGRSFVHSKTQVRVFKKSAIGADYSFSQYGFYHHSSTKQNARYAGRPNGLMHNLPAGHYVRSNDWKRAQMAAAGAASTIKGPKGRVMFGDKQAEGALKHLITSEKVLIEPKRTRAKKAD